MAKRDPHDALGVERGAEPARIKAAWRKLARANHPDLTGDDPAASRLATRRMAEINDAYAALSRGGAKDRGAAPAADIRTDGTRRRGGPPPPRPTRPVTGRVDTTSTFRPRNQTTSAARDADGRRGATLGGQPPVRGERVRQEAPRASTPTGPLERGRLRNFRRRRLPRLDVARRVTIDFGKFHGHALGDIAAFEPSYIDWVASTVKRDPELVAAARAVQADLDARGVPRRSHPAPVRPSRTA